MKSWRHRYLLLLLLALSCKRDELPFDNQDGVVLPGTIKSLEEERAASLKKQEEADADIKKALRDPPIEVKEPEVVEKEKEKEKEKPTVDVGVGTDPEPSPSALGPFTLSDANLCLEVQGKNIADGAPLGMSVCSGQTHQSFSFVPADDTGAYRLMPLHSHKCLRVEAGSTDLGAKLIQSPCDTSDLAEQFYVLGLDETNFLLQSVKSQYCFNLQTSGILTQALCDSEASTRFKVNKLAP